MALQMGMGSRNLGAAIAKRGAVVGTGLIFPRVEGGGSFLRCSSV